MSRPWRDPASPLGGRGGLVAVIGGGAAGFFAAIQLKTMVPEMDVTIFERSAHVLSKVKVSGGGRCNCTNSFASVANLSQVYPRGHRLLSRLFHTFSHQDAYTWFESHGVPLVTQADDCVFPRSQDSQTIIDCFLREAHRLGVHIVTGHKVESYEALRDRFDYVVVTTGGSPRAEGLEWLRQLGHKIEQPVPSLFTFAIDDKALHGLMGTVAEDCAVQLAGSSFRAEGPLLITHWGMSGPAILRLSSYAARHLAEACYKATVCVNWCNENEEQVRASLSSFRSTNAQKSVTTVSPVPLTQRLWAFLVGRALGEKGSCRWSELSKKDFNRLVNVLTADAYPLAGRAPFKDEFVTCGGISLSSVHPSTLESKAVPRLYFAGEVLDIDGITGGFNFQAAWTTAYCVATAIATAARS